MEYSRDCRQALNEPESDLDDVTLERWTGEQVRVGLSEFALAEHALYV